MSDIFQQLTELVFGSMPTMVLFLILVTAYSRLVHKPLSRLLAERREKTLGAMEKATAAIAAAEAKTVEYETKIRAARGRILQSREQQLQKLNAERETALLEARAAGQSKVQIAREDFEKSTSAAKLQIAILADELAEQIVRQVSRAVQPPVARGHAEGAQ